MENIQFTTIHQSNGVSVIHITGAADYFIFERNGRFYSINDWYGEEFMVEGMTEAEMHDMFNEPFIHHCHMEYSAAEIQQMIEEICG